MPQIHHISTSQVSTPRKFGVGCFLWFHFAYFCLQNSIKLLSRFFFLVSSESEFAAVWLKPGTTRASDRLLSMKRRSPYQSGHLVGHSGIMWHPCFEVLLVFSHIRCAGTPRVAKRAGGSRKDRVSFIGESERAGNCWLGSWHSNS